MTQCGIIAKIMLMERWKKEWTAKDFQREQWFIGYEASARMSDLIRMYPASFIIGKDGRFRTLAINWDNSKGVEDLETFIKLEEGIEE